MSPLLERFLVWLAVAAAVGLGGIGFWLGEATQDFEWPRRFGAAIVCVEALLVLLHYSQDRRLELLQKELGSENIYLEREIAAAKLNLTKTGVILAIFGELLHGFGDTLLEILNRL